MLHCIIPSIINLELTNKCNLNCVFCDRPILKQSMKIGDMDENLLISILESVKENNIYELGLVGLGEPLLNGNLERHLSIINDYSQYFTRISINTNGILMDEEKSDTIIQSRINLITFSLNATNRWSYKKIMGADRFDLVVNNIKRFIALLKYHKRSDLNVSIQFMSSDLNDESEMNALFKDEISNSVVVYNRFLFDKPSISTRNKDMVNIKTSMDSKRYPCWSLYSRVYIDINGNLYPCTIGNDCYRENSNLNLGNVRNQNIVSIFNDKRIRLARDMSEKNKIPFLECNECTAWCLFPNNFYYKDNRWIYSGRGQIRMKELDRVG